MSDIKLGSLINTQQSRDAVHVAVAPMKANEILFPGQHVGVTPGDAGLASTQTKHVGVVDPYLRDRLLPGDVFWMFMYPQTVEGLRHDWTHPAFATPAPTVEDEELEYDGCRGC